MTAPTSAQWLRAAAARIVTGSQILARERTRRLAGWVRSVWRRTMSWLGEASGIAWALRLAVLLAAAWVLRKIGVALAAGVARRLEASPWLMWPALALWLIAAWRAADPKRRGPAPAAAEPVPEDGPAAELTTDEIRALLIRVFGLDPQVHITVLAERLTEATGRPWSTADVRAAVGAAGGRVDTGVRMPGLNPSTGVRRSTLPDPSPATPPAPVEGVVVAGQEPSKGPATATPTGPATAAAGKRPDIVQDPNNPHHWLVKEPA
ncbi:hypothetical protein [Streptomyces filamentosus]|uniref:hypothetical protein n=1 Tax=Streptomyces filamentosus TaxID=67294 RepID=UPI00123B68B2|nr:hypothetical protein [Streptomyces filamentosus]KAA6220017.1 hypothetical protein CP979_26325 [Streptomyces filamentosus]